MFSASFRPTAAGKKLGKGTLNVEADTQYAVLAMSKHLVNYRAKVVNQ
jgi:hypothetical protein